MAGSGLEVLLSIIKGAVVLGVVTTAISIGGYVSCYRQVDKMFSSQKFDEAAIFNQMKERWGYGALASTAFILASGAAYSIGRKQQVRC